MTRTSTSTRFKLKFLPVFSKKDTPKTLFSIFSPKKFVRLLLVKEVKPSPDSRMKQDDKTSYIW